MACRLVSAKPLSEPMLEYFNWTLGNKFQWNLNCNLHFFIKENALENGVCEMASILSRPQCVYYSPDGGTSQLRGDCFKNCYELLRLRNLKFLPLWIKHIFQCMEIPHKTSYPYIEDMILFKEHDGILTALKSMSSYTFWNSPLPQKAMLSDGISEHVGAWTNGWCCVEGIFRCIFSENVCEMQAWGPAKLFKFQVLQVNCMSQQ